jgi:hypothetical protein
MTRRLDCETFDAQWGFYESLEKSDLIGRLMKKDQKIRDLVDEVLVLQEALEDANDEVRVQGCLDEMAT